MIPSHYELNVALNGQHYCNIVFAQGMFEGQVQESARLLSRSISDNEGVWTFRLIYVECTGHEKEF